MEGLQFNVSAYLFTHLIEGVNTVILGRDLRNVYIEQTGNKYQVWMETEKEIPLLEKHKQLVTSIEDDDIILYSFKIDSKYHGDYRNIRNNKAKELTREFKKMAIKLSGKDYNRATPRGTVSFNGVLLAISDDFSYMA